MQRMNLSESRQSYKSEELWNDQYVKKEQQQKDNKHLFCDFSLNYASCSELTKSTEDAVSSQSSHTLKITTPTSEWCLLSIQSSPWHWLANSALWSLTPLVLNSGAPLAPSCSRCSPITGFQDMHRTLLWSLWMTRWSLGRLQTMFRGHDQSCRVLDKEHSFH